MTKLGIKKGFVALWIFVGLALTILPWLILYFSTGLSYLIFETEERNLLLFFFLLLSFYASALAYSLGVKVFLQKKKLLGVIFLIWLLLLVSSEIIVLLVLTNKFSGQIAEISAFIGGGLASLPLIIFPLEIYLLSLYKKKENQ
ncbi:MAG: hypothetical protein LKJ88_06635 [Bacilli bacterium]|jgi:hypothetical protein|nr:hypothetical protein [Bacilli bacterium]